MKERYEQEIEQLLRELDSETEDQGRARAPAGVTPPLDDQPSPFAPRPRQRTRLISPSKLALGGAVTALLGLFLVKAAWLSLAGLIIMVGAIAWMFFRRMSSQPQQYWRGRAVEPEPQGAWQRFRRWLAR